MAADTAKKSKKTDQHRALMKIAEYVLKNGVDKGIKAPNSHMLGYNVDVLMTKALRQKSDVAFDNQEHSFHVIPSTDAKSPGGVGAIIISHVSVTDRDGRKHADLIDIKMSPRGKLLTLIHAIGFTGDVARTKMDINSNEAKILYKSELNYQLTKIDFRSLIQ